MNLLSWGKSVALLSLAVFLGFGSYLVWTATKAVESLGQQGSSVLTQASTTLTTINAGSAQTFDNLNRLCGTDKRCGAFEDFARTTNSARLAFGQITVLSRFEKPQLEAINQQELQLFADTHKVLGGLSDTVTSANTALGGIVPLENEIDTETVALQKSTRDFDTLLISPDVTGTLHGFNVTSNNFAATSTDFQTKFHAILFPPPCQGKFCFVIKAWPYIKAATELSEPAYYFSQLIPTVK
jgi:hypothetical protein